MRLSYRSLVLVLYMAFVLFPILFWINRNRRAGTKEGLRKADDVSVRLANHLSRLFGIEVEVTGTPVEGPVLFAANHLSWLDIPVLHSGCAMGFVGKAEIDEWPVFGFIARTGGTIFHQRGCHDSAEGVITAMIERLQQGRAVAIFPEGGIKPGEQANVRVFHARMFRPAVDVGCLVQPVMVRYVRNGRRDDDFAFRPNESMTKNFFRVLAGPGVTAELHFLPAFSAAGKPRRELAEASRAAVVSVYDN